MKKKSDIPFERIYIDITDTKRTNLKEIFALKLIINLKKIYFDSCSQGQPPMNQVYCSPGIVSILSDKIFSPHTVYPVRAVQEGRRIMVGWLVIVGEHKSKRIYIHLDNNLEQNEIIMTMSKEHSRNIKINSIMSDVDDMPTCKKVKIYSNYDWCS